MVKEGFMGEEAVFDLSLKKWVGSGLSETKERELSRRKGGESQHEAQRRAS